LFALAHDGIEARATTESSEDAKTVRDCDPRNVTDGIISVEGDINTVALVAPTCSKKFDRIKLKVYETEARKKLEGITIGVDIEYEFR